MVGQKEQFTIAVTIEPMPGYQLLRTGDEILVMAAEDSTRNVLLDADTLCRVLAELADGGLLDDFGHGVNQMWQVNAVLPLDPH